MLPTFLSPCFNQKRERENWLRGGGSLKKEEKKRGRNAGEEALSFSLFFSFSLFAFVRALSVSPSRPRHRVWSSLLFFLFLFICHRKEFTRRGWKRGKNEIQKNSLFVSLSLSLSFLSFLLFSSLTVAPRTFSLSLSRALSKESFSPRLQSPPLSKRNTPIKKIPRKGSRKKFMKEPRGTPRASTDPKTPPPRSPPPRPPAPARSEAVPCTSPS